MSVAEVAGLFAGWVVEATGSNDGPWVEAIQRITGNTKGDYWCASFVCFVLDIAYQGKCPLPRSGSCDALLEAARGKGWLVDRPKAGDVFLVMKTLTDAVHTGIVTGVTRTGFTAVEGNAADPTHPDSRNGWGVFQRSRVLSPAKYQFIRLP